LDIYDFDNLTIVTFECSKQVYQRWIGDETDGTIRSKFNGEYLTIQPELEVWAGPLTGGS
jgi:hypothetical protein